MNKELMIEAFEDAKKNNVPLIKHTYHDNGCFCAAGYLAHFIGIPDQLILSNSIVHPTGQPISYKVAEHYGLSLLRWSALMDANDKLFSSWDDAIEFIKRW